MKTRYQLSAVIILACVIVFGCQKQDPSVTMQPVLEQYVKFWNTGDFENIETIMHEDFVLRNSPTYEAIEGIEGFKKYVQMFRTEFPDFTVSIDETMYSEGRAAARWTVEATNTGEGRFSASGTHVIVQGLSLHHFKDGKIFDGWVAQNDLHFFEQLGFQLTPPSAPDELKD